LPHGQKQKKQLLENTPMSSSLSINYRCGSSTQLPGAAIALEMPMSNDGDQMVEAF